MITQNLKTLKDVVQTFSDEQKCIDYLESIIWNGNPVSMGQDCSVYFYM